jgi:hypothetical protein
MTCCDILFAKMKMTEIRPSDVVHQSTRARPPAAVDQLSERLRHAAKWVAFSWSSGLCDPPKWRSLSRPIHMDQLVLNPTNQVQVTWRFITPWPVRISVRFVAGAEIFSFPTTHRPTLMTNKQHSQFPLPVKLGITYCKDYRKLWNASGMLKNKNKMTLTTGKGTHTALWTKLILEKLVVTQLVKKFPAIMEPENPLACSKTPASKL